MAPVAMSARSPTRTHTHVGPCQGERYAALEREAKKVCVFVRLVCVCVCVCTTLRKRQGKEHMNREKGQTQ